MLIDTYIKKVNMLPVEHRLSIIRRELIKGRVLKSDCINVNFEDIVTSLDFVYPDSWDIQLTSSTVEYVARSQVFDLQFAEEVGRGEDVDITTDSRFKRKIVFNIEFIIHFDKLHITNSKGYEHNIYDMYIMLKKKVLPTMLTFINFYGRRHTATKEEILSKYQHSHLPSRSYKIPSTNYQEINGDSFDSWREFCKGHGDIVDNLYTLSSRYNDNLFRLFLFQLKSFLEWESLEGGPYNKIGEVMGRCDDEGLGERVTKDRSKYIFNHYESFDGNVEIDLDFRITNNSVITIIDNEKLENFLKVDGEDSNVYPSNILVTRDAQGDLFSFRTIPNNFPPSMLSERGDLDKVDFYFRGELQKFKIIEETITYNREFYIHPKIKYYVKQRIEKRIQEKRLRGSILEELHTLTH
jgi:hypothetical protein